MTTYRNIEIMEVPAPGSGYVFDIGECGMICDTAEQAREMIDHALDEECFTYREVFCWPDADFSAGEATTWPSGVWCQWR